MPDLSPQSRNKADIRQRYGFVSFTPLIHLAGLTIAAPRSTFCYFPPAVRLTKLAVYCGHKQ